MAMTDVSLDKNFAYLRLLLFVFSNYESNGDDVCIFLRSKFCILMATVISNDKNNGDDVCILKIKMLHTYGSGYFVFSNYELEDKY